METLQFIINIVLHLDQHLTSFVAHYGTWVYLLLFIIIFSETGIIILPFLPGDSLLFSAGAIASNAASGLHIHTLVLLFIFASTLGNNVNYLIGRAIGPRIFSSTDSWLFNKKHLSDTHAFYEKHGAKTIVIARFLPIIRTFAPFVAGLGYMNHKQFFLYNLLGSILWIASLTYLGYLFGDIPAVQKHFSLVIFLIIGMTLLPVLIGIMKRAYLKPSS